MIKIHKIESVPLSKRVNTWSIRFMITTFHMPLSRIGLFPSKEEHFPDEETLGRPIAVAVWDLILSDHQIGLKRLTETLRISHESVHITLLIIRIFRIKLLIWMKPEINLVINEMEALRVSKVNEISFSKILLEKFIFHCFGIVVVLFS